MEKYYQVLSDSKDRYLGRLKNKTSEFRNRKTSWKTEILITLFSVKICRESFIFNWTISPIVLNMYKFLDIFRVTVYI